MFNFSYTATDYLLVVLMLAFLVGVTLLRNSVLSILRSLRQAKTEQGRTVGNAERDASAKPGMQFHQHAQPSPQGEPANRIP